MLVSDAKINRTYLKIKNAIHPNLFRHAGLDPASSKQLFLLDSGFRRNDEGFYD